jgi:hypothetical protein
LRLEASLNGLDHKTAAVDAKVAVMKAVLDAKGGRQPSRPAGAARRIQVKTSTKITWICWWKHSGYDQLPAGHR